MTIGVLGGKFALFAWVPALCKKYPKENILVEKRHINEFNNRPELQQYKNRIIWVDGDNNIIFQSELLIIAIPPNQLKLYLLRIISSKTIKQIIVEKPICESPELSESFIEIIESKGIKVISTYLFFYTDWYFTLLDSLKNDYNENNSILIDWNIINKNPIDSWKRNNELGGGDIKFYGIHIIAILASLNYEISNCTLNNNKFKAIFKHESYPDIFLIINSDSQYNKFILESSFEHYIANQNSPFNNSMNNEDNRILYLIDLLYDFEDNYDYLNKLMKQTIELWKKVELKLN